MGKYSEADRFLSDGTNKIQLYIANELAEANRLKRIELRIQITQVKQDLTLTDEEIKSVNRGLADIKAGRVYTTEQLEKELGIDLEDQA